MIEGNEIWRKELSYDVNFELKLTRILKEKLPINITPIKNNDPYSFDLKIFEYDMDLKKNVFKGYIEIERALTWRIIYPWDNYSFLMRKVYEFDEKNKEFIKEFKEYYDKTVYLRTNYDGTDMFCLDIPTIAKLKVVYQKIFGKERNDWYFRTGLDDDRVNRGLDNCIMFINNYLLNNNNNKYNSCVLYQSKLDIKSV